MPRRPVQTGRHFSTLRSGTSREIDSQDVRCQHGLGISQGIVRQGCFLLPPTPAYPHQFPGFRPCRSWNLRSRHRHGRFGRWGAVELVTQASSPKADALRVFAQTAAESSANCVFGWAEGHFDGVFTPAPGTSQRAAPYFFRTYGSGASTTYLATDWPAQRVLLLGPATAGQVLDVGALADFTHGAACP